MSRRPSVASLSSIGSGLLKPISLPALSESRAKPSQSNGSAGIPPRTISYGTNLEAIAERKSDTWDPDDLFSRHTVTEVKAIQQRLRSDADTKQEELRLMVGERYRDLLHASASIISIARSSDRVLSAIHEVRQATASIRPFESANISAGGQGDEHLQTLQSLAAHLKLLLDAPEHLWRFMERKLYLHAAWLFLLSRVVYRSLLRGGEDGEIAWHELGIDISEQFPIMQRQWDTVSQFRSQISHKATMALRETSLTSSEVCAILLTLHLLESRPLPETLATFLAQRTRSLKASLDNQNTPAPNNALERPVAKSRKVMLRETRQKLKSVLDIVARTVGISRRIFMQTESSSALMRDVLQHVQGEDETLAHNLPSEVALTSQTLLTSLPSSNHFLLLPAAIKSYKPYIDGSHLVTSEQDEQVRRKVGDWFQKAVQHIQTAMASWFSRFATIRDVWELRRWCKTWLKSTKELDAQEKAQFGAVLDNVCRQIATQIWLSALNDIENIFREQMTAATDNIKRNVDAAAIDRAPVGYLFNAPPVPSVAHGATIVASGEVSFHAYRDSLKRQIIARTPQLDDVLSVLEKHVIGVHEDFIVTQQESENASQPFMAQLAEHYSRDTEALSLSLVRTLQDQLDGLDREDDLQVVVFLGRISDHLSSSISVTEHLACTKEATEVFRAQLAALYGRTLERWHAQTVSNVIRTHWPEPSSSHHEGNLTDDISLPVRPSAQLLDSLLALSAATQTLGVHTDPKRLSVVVQQLLGHFIVALTRRLDEYGNPVLPAQSLWDLTFLLLLLEAWGSGMQAEKSLLLSRIPWSTDATWPPNVRESLMESLSRSQVLLGLLLPSPALLTASAAGQGKQSGLLHLGSPSIDTQYQPVFDLVQPSARFGLLLVGSSTAR